MSARTSSANRERATVGAVLAGGGSSRMGAPKAGLNLAGRRLISYPLEALTGAGLEPMVVAKAGQDLPDLDCPVILDAEPTSHPAAGILAALRAARGPVVVLACDMPFVPAQLLTVLAQVPARVAVPRLTGGLQPLLARYEPHVAPDLLRAVQGSKPLRRAIESLDPLVLGPDELAGFGDPNLIAFNVNDRDDLAAAERLLTPTASR